MITLIAAVDKNLVIGNKGEIPWYIQEDLKFFKHVTEYSFVVMGYRTFKSLEKIGKFPLKNRNNIVIMRKNSDEYLDFVETYMGKKYDRFTNVTAIHSLDTVEELGRTVKKEIFIIGGSKIYYETIGIADKIILTHIESEYDGDTYFPKIEEKQWKMMEEINHFPETESTPEYRRRVYLNSQIL